MATILDEFGATLFDELGASILDESTAVVTSAGLDALLLSGVILGTNMEDKSGSGYGGRVT